MESCSRDIRRAGANTGVHVANDVPGCGPNVRATPAWDDLRVDTRAAVAAPCARVELLEDEAEHVPYEAVADAAASSAAVPVWRRGAAARQDDDDPNLDPDDP